MKTFNINAVQVQIFKDDKGAYWGGFIFGFNDKRNYCGFLGGSLNRAFGVIRKTLSTN